MFYPILVLFLIAVAAIFFIYRRLTQSLNSLEEKQNNNQTLQLMQALMKNTQEQINTALRSINDTRLEVAQNLTRNTDSLQRQLHESSTEMNKRLDNAAKVISLYSKEIGGLKEIGRKLEDFQDLLKAPKLRGNVGEYILRDLLEQILPRHNFSLQYKFKEGQVVDAIIKTDQGLIPIDAKFPMENFRLMMKAGSEAEGDSAKRVFLRDVKKHITDIAKKYILPQEGTMDFAVMYVPSETIWYEIVRDDTELNDFAWGQKVLLVSPNSFYYFLQTVMVGMRGKRVEEAAGKIMQALSDIKQETSHFSKDLSVLGRHITNAKSASDNVANKFIKLASKIDTANTLEAPESKQIKETKAEKLELFERG